MDIKSPVIEKFFKQYRPMLFRREEILARSDDLKNQVYYLNQGYVRVYTVSDGGNELTIHIYATNAIFPILWADSVEDNEHYFESLTPVEAYKGERDKFQELVTKTPQAYQEIIKQLTSFSESVVKKLESKIFYGAYRQVVSAILNLAECFSPESGNVIISYWFTHQDLSNITGLARETVTLEMNKLVREKLISYQDHFMVVPNMELLKRELYKDG